MDTLHFASYCAAIVGFFVWIDWQRKSGLRQVLGAIVIVAVFAWLLPRAIQYIWSK